MNVFFYFTVRRVTAIWHIAGGLAQLGEHLPCTQKVIGSNPIASTLRAFLCPIAPEKQELR